MVDRQKDDCSYSVVSFEHDSGHVIKTPKGLKKADKLLWYEHQKRAMLFLVLNVKTKGIFTPEIIAFDENQVVETYQSGYPLTDEKFENLSPKVQKKIVRCFAQFLFNIHQKHTLNVRGTVSVNFLKSSIYFKAFCLPAVFLKKYQVCLKKLQNYQASFPKVLCYRDLKAEHLLYDDKTDMLSVIDFGAVGFDIPIKEFCLDNPIQSKLSLTFLKEVILAYNKISSNKIDISIVQDYLYCAVFNELVRVCRAKKVPLQDIVGLGIILKDFLETLEKTFLRI